MSTLYYVLYGSALAEPSVAQIKAGQNVNGVAAVAAGNATGITTTQSPYTFAAATGLTGSTPYKVSFVWSDGTNDSNRITSAEFTTSANIQSGAGASDGSATAAGTGESTAASVGASDGVATTAGVATSTAEASGSASGTSTAAGAGEALAQDSGAGSSTGSSTASAVGAATVAAAGLSDGAATAAGTGSSIAAAAGSVSGTSTASAVGEAQEAGSATGSAAGTSTAAGVGASIAAASGSAAGTSSAEGASPRPEPEPRERRGVPPPYTRPQMRLRVRIGDDEFVVSSIAQAEYLLRQAEELAQETARAKAGEIAERAQKPRARIAKRAAPVVRIEAPEPVAEVEAIRERVAQTNARIQQMYVQALQTELIARAIAQRLEDDEADAVSVLLLA